MKKFYVYLHTCPNGKRYVGVTTKIKPEYRWREGNGYQYNKHFYSAILKYGWDNITHEVFEVDSREEMYRKEVELISFYHSNDPEYGYNNSVGGENSSLGCTRSEEARKHIAEANRRKAKDPEYRKKQSESKKGRSLCEEHRKKLSETRKERWSDPEYRKHMVEAQKKVHSDPEYRKHMSEVQKGKPHKPFSEETKRRMSEAKKGKPKPKVKIKLQDGTLVEMPKNLIARNYINKGKEFEYVS